MVGANLSQIKSSASAAPPPINAGSTQIWSDVSQPSGLARTRSADYRCGRYQRAGEPRRRISRCARCSVSPDQGMRPARSAQYRAIEEVGVLSAPEPADLGKTASMACHKQQAPPKRAARSRAALGHA